MDMVRESCSGLRLRHCLWLKPVRSLMKSPSGLERVPGWTLRKFEIAEIGPEAEPDTRADRYNHDVVRYKRRHAEAADQICRAVHAAEPLENSLGYWQVVNQHHGARAVGTVIETKRWPLPVHARVAGILGV